MSRFMKFYILLAAAAAMLLAGPIYAVEKPAAAPVIKAESAILVDAATGQVIFEKNAHAKRPIASTTKIMTAILALEKTSPDDVVVASKRASEEPFTSLHLRQDEEVSLQNLLYALMIRSANDTAIALAEHIAGSVDNFSKMMNDKAKELGALETNFRNPNGLYAEGHYSTASDLAIITRYALKNPAFNEIVATTSKRIERSINKEDLLLTSKCKFLKTYPGADGVKSGYIKQAGYCYVGSATRDGWRLLSVVLKSDDSQAETAALMDYGFGKFERVALGTPDSPITTAVVKHGADALQVVPSSMVEVVVPSGQREAAKFEIELDELRAPVRKGDKVGTMVAYLGDKIVCSVELRAANDVNETVTSILWPWVRTIGLLSLISIGAVCGRAVAKNAGNGRSRFS